MAKKSSVPKRTLSPKNRKRDVYSLAGAENLASVMNADRNYVVDDLQSYINRMDAGVPAEELATTRADLLNSIRTQAYRSQAEELLKIIDGLDKGAPFPVTARKSGRVAGQAESFFG
jgi:hypothetical protein